MTMPESSDPCVMLPWDSDFFGRRIARVKSHCLDAPLIDEIARWTGEQAIDCLYFLADSNHTPTIALAETAGFRLVDVRLTLDLNNPAAAATTLAATRPPSVHIREAQPNDMDRLAAIARTAHTDTRFYADPHFDYARCEDLYETWIRRSAEGFADQVLVSDQGGRATGYITCTLHAADPATGTIGLLGVGSDSRGAGLGSALVITALDWFGQRGCRQVTVVTQGRNIDAQRLYQKCRFRTRSLQLWYHRWLTD